MPEADAKLIQQIAALTGVEIRPKRAKELLPALLGIYEGDAEIAKLKLGNLSPVGSTWGGDGDD